MLGEPIPFIQTATCTIVLPFRELYSLLILIPVFAPKDGTPPPFSFAQFY